MHQRVSYGEEPCFGPDPEPGNAPRRKKHLRYNRSVIRTGYVLLTIAVAGALLDRFASGLTARAGAAAFVISVVMIIGFLANPVITSLEVRGQRRKMHSVK